MRSSYFTWTIGLAILAAGTISACADAAEPANDAGSGGIDSPQDEDTTGDVDQADVFEVADDAGLADVEADGIVTDHGIDLPCEPGTGCVGELCEEAGDCQSGNCVPSREGAVCSEGCEDGCPDGWQCGLWNQSESAPALVCLDAALHLCRPCYTDLDCSGPLEDQGNRCMDAGGGQGSYCGVSCEENDDCPEGYGCQEYIDPITTQALMQCTPDSGLCLCTPWATSVGAATACGNEHCPGHRYCGPDGLTPCDADQAADEVCDQLDNDCDGQVDEALGTETCGIGPCLHEQKLCVDGIGQVCDPLEGATPEVCDGIDNDCDGEADQGLDALICGLGPCAKSVVACVDGVPQSCDPLSEASPEVCDGEDNDCDGELDEDLGALSCGLGVCEKTIPACADGIVQECDPYAGASQEICDGLDNDCEGNIDQDLGEVSCGLGACEHAVPACIDGEAQSCDPLAGKSDEVCDGNDNDCDGATDEELGSTPCGEGACATEVFNCVAGEAQLCEPLSVAADESCDGVDNDCDGNTDEALSPLVCGLGACLHEVESCVDGEQQDCDPFEGASAEICDGDDNDCDGEIDELGTIPCGVGACATDLVVCLGGVSQECEPFSGASQEVCDGLDNDCDGETDEGEDLCLDDDWCTVDSCDKGLGQCEHTSLESPACGFACTPSFEHIGGASLFGRGLGADLAQAGPTSMVAATSLGVGVYDISTWTQLKAVGYWVSPAPVSGVAMTEDGFVLAALGTEGLAVLDISDPAKPIQIGELAHPSDRVDAANGVAVVASGADVAVVDLHVLGTPSVYAGLALPAELDGQSVEVVYRAGNLAYLGVGHHVLSLDLSVPTAPLQVGLLDTGAPVLDLLLVGTTLHVANDLQGLTSVDVSLPGNLTIVESLVLLINGDTTVSSVTLVEQVEDQVVAYHDSWISTFPIQPGEGLLGDEMSSGGYGLSDGLGMVSKNGLFYLFNDAGDVKRLGIKDDGNVGPMGSFVTGSGSVDALEVSGATAILSLDDVGFELVDLTDEKEPVSLGTVLHSGTGYATLAGNYAYVATKKNMDIFDVSDPANPVKLGNFHKAAGGPYRITVVDDLAYLAWGSYGSNVIYYYKGLRIVDVSDPSNPVQVGMDSGWTATDLAVDLPYVYVTAGSFLRIIDVSDPTDPEQINSFKAVVGEFSSVTKSGNFVYALDYDQLTVIDVSDPLNATKVLNVELDGVFNSRLEVVGDFVYVITKSDLLAVDVSDPSQPIIYETNAGGVDLVAYGDYLLRATGGGLSFYDISEPAQPRSVSATLYGSQFNGFSTRMVLEGDYAYLADTDGGLRVLDIQQPEEPKALGQYNTSTISALVKSGNHVVVSNAGGLASVKVGNPQEPEYYDSSIFASNKKDLALKGGWLLVPDGSDVEVFDPPSMKLKTFDNGAHGFHLSVVGDILYTCYSGELYIYDVADVLNAVLLYEQPSPGDPPCYDLVATGTTLVTVRAPFAGNATFPPQPGVLAVWNVAVPSAPVVQGTVEFDAPIESLTVAGNLAYVATGDDVLVFDVGDPSAPSLLTTLSTPGPAQEAVAHGPYLFVADGEHYLQTWQIACSPPP